MKTITIEELDRMFDDGEDISEYLDWDKARLANFERELVELDLLKQRLAELDAEAVRLGTTRDRLVSQWIRERLEAKEAAE